jgi:hypothetical protein
LALSGFGVAGIFVPIIPELCASIQDEEDVIESLKQGGEEEKDQSVRDSVAY